MDVAARYTLLMRVHGRRLGHPIQAAAPSERGVALRPPTWHCVLAAPPLPQTARVWRVVAAQSSSADADTSKHLRACWRPVQVRREQLPRRLLARPSVLASRPRPAAGHRPCRLTWVLWEAAEGCRLAGKAAPALPSCWSGLRASTLTVAAHSSIAPSRRHEAMAGSSPRLLPSTSER